MMVKTSLIKDVNEIVIDLKELVEGDVLSKDWERSMYATDASPYEIIPLCVVLPKTKEDVLNVVKYAYKHHVPIIARGGGSGLVGQAIGSGIVIDFTRHLNKILEFNIDENYVIVQPGIYKSVLEKHLNNKGKFLPPDPSSSDYCTIGGMISNNSCGAHTVKYGSTIDYVESLQVALANGEVIRTHSIKIGGDTWRQVIEGENLESKIYKEVEEVARKNKDLIDSGTPKVKKNSSGYRLERVLKDGFLDLGKLLVSSEGTLAIVLEAKLKVLDLPKHKALALLHFDSLERAGDAVMDLLKFEPSALEIIDSQILNMAKTSYPDIVESIPNYIKAVILTEFDGSVKRKVIDKVTDLKKLVKRKKLSQGITISYDEAGMKKLWGLRKKALLFTYKLRRGDKRPVTFVEDTVVDPSRLGEYIRKLYEIYEKYGLETVIYGHAGDGHLHSRPLLDLKNTEDNEIMVKVADEVFSLVTSFGGSITGEHGDGLSRSEYIKSVYGPDVYELFRKIKHIFDPTGILNPGKKVVDEDGLINKNLRTGLDYRRRNVQTALNWGISGNKLIKRITGHNEELSYAGEVELCHGCGGCRETVFTGRMCPVYKAFEGEVDSCRGRNNLLRWMLKTTGLDEGFGHSDEYGEAIYKHCIQCKMCHIDCSSNVNVAKLMAEARARYAAVKGLPKGYKYFMDMDPYAEWGSRLAPLSNWLFRFPPYRLIMEWITGIDKHRNFPPFRKKTFTKRFKEYKAAAVSKSLDKKVVFFYDTYINYNNPSLGMDIVNIFERNQYHTIVPIQKSSGLPALVEGAPDIGKSIAEFNVANLAPYAQQGIPIVCFSPSAGVTLKMEYLNVLDTEECRIVADNTLDIHEFLYGLHKKGDLNTGFEKMDREVYVHMHCHSLVQKVENDVMNLLQLIPGLRIDVLEKGCCGVGGSFSFIKNNFDMSLEMGRDLIEAVRSSDRDVYSTGESCMLQMQYGSKKHIGTTTELIRDAYSLRGLEKEN